MIQLESEVLIAASTSETFEYCRDPRRIYAADPGYAVVDATVSPAGVGTTAHLVAKVLGNVVTEDVVIEYTQFVPNERIVFEGRPKMRLVGRTLGSSEVWRHTFTIAPADGGTSLTWAVANTVAGPWWEQPLTHVGSRMMGKEIRARLGRIKAGVEQVAAATS